jgi:putative flippase GtrA
MTLPRETSMLLRFLVVGIVNTGFGISVYWLLLYAGFLYQWASLLSLLLGIIFSFNTHKLAVFKTGGFFFRYVMIWIAIYFIHIKLISMIRDDIGDYFAGIAVLPVNLVLSFMLMKHFVFRKVKDYRIS